MILWIALHNPQATASALDAANKPGQVDASQLQSSLADFAMETLKCYHRTARFRGVDVLGSPWKEQEKYGAEHSAVLRINLDGVTGAHYQMVIAAMVKDKSYRTFVVAQNTPVPYNKNCTLEHWTTATAAH